MKRRQAKTVFAGFIPAIHIPQRSFAAPCADWMPDDPGKTPRTAIKPGKPKRRFTALIAKLNKLPAQVEDQEDQSSLKKNWRMQPAYRNGSDISPTSSDLSDIADGQNLWLNSRWPRSATSLSSS